MNWSPDVPTNYRLSIPVSFVTVPAEARPNGLKVDTKFEYRIRSIRAGNTTPIAIGDQRHLSRLVGSKKPGPRLHDDDIDCDL
jgi:hypothetical protein